MSRYCRYVITTEGLRFPDGALTVELPAAGLLPGGRLRRLARGKTARFRVVSDRGAIAPEKRARMATPAVTVRELQQFAGPDGTVPVQWQAPQRDGAPGAVVTFALDPARCQGRKARRVATFPPKVDGTGASLLCRSFVGAHCPPPTVT